MHVADAGAGFWGNGESGGRLRILVLRLCLGTKRKRQDAASTKALAEPVARDGGVPRQSLGARK
jgi:hypothetical protein